MFLLIITRQLKGKKYFFELILHFEIHHEHHFNRYIKSHKAS